MTMPNSSAPHYFLLKPHLGDALANDPILNGACTLALVFSGETTVGRLLVLAGSLAPTLQHNPNLLAVVLLSNCAADQNRAVLSKLREHGLEGLSGALRYFATTPIEPGVFVSASARWERDAARWADAPEALKIIQLAKMGDTLRRQDWHNFLQRQQLLERASLLIDGLTMSVSANQRWLDDLASLIQELSTTGAATEKLSKRVLR